MAIKMRRGNEADFDPSKMLPGEWAVSTDTKYVRMCFSPGIVLRMATYEAFESDMSEIRKILSECQSIQTAVELIQQNVTNSELVIENYVKEAKQYRDEAEQFRNEAFSTTPEGYEDLVKNVSDNTVKIDTIIEKAELNIKNNVKGSNIHLTDSAESNVVALELYGKTEQNAYTGKNLLDCRRTTDYSGNGITVTFDTIKQSISASGTATANTQVSITNNYNEIKEKIANGGTFVMSLKNATYDIKQCNISISYSHVDGTIHFIIADGTPVVFEPESVIQAIALYIPSGITINLTDVKIQLEENTEATEWEPYVGGVPSPSPSYPQEIKSVKGKNELDCRGLTEQEVNGGKFTPVYDDNGNLLYVNVNGTFSANTNYVLCKTPKLSSGKLIMSGCPNGGSTETYFLQYSSNVSIAYSDNGGGIEVTEMDYNTYPDAEVKIQVRSGCTANNIKFYPMIRLASITDDTYVPYGLLRIKTHGKNFVDMSNPLAVTNMSYNDTTKTYVQTSADTFTSFNLYIRQLKEYNITTGYEWILDKVITTAQTISCTFTKLSGYNAISIKHNGQAKDVGISLDISNLKDGVKYYFKMNIVNATQGSIEFGEIIISETESDYVQYQSSEITLSEPVELNGFNGVYDVVTSDGVTRRFAEVVFDGSSDEYWERNSTNTTDDKRFRTDKIRYSVKHYADNVLCTNYSNIGVGETYNRKVGIGIDGEGYFYIYDDDIKSLSLADFKTWLTNNPMTVVYELATPTTEELQTDFTALKTFYPETYVLNDADCDMSITYTADAKNYIDNKIALLTTAIYNNI